MSLTTGRGPLSAAPAGQFFGTTYIEPYPRRLRATKAVQVVIDTQRAVLVHRQGHPPTYAIPADDVIIDAHPLPEIGGYLEVPWDAVDEWLEEDHRVIGHPRNPYHRVDCLPTSRHVKVEIGGQFVAQTDQAMAVFETGLDPRVYIPRGAVQMHLLVASNTTTFCPYKGFASYWSNDQVTDVAWSYDKPFPECAAVAGMLSFYASKCTLVIDPPFAT